MDTELLGQLSRILYAPVALLLYATAAVVHLYALTTGFGRGGEGVARGVRAERIGFAVAVLGVAAHVGHEVVRGLAQQRLPLGNMFEFTSLTALAGVVAGLVYLRYVRRRPELNGFVLMAGTLMMASALLVYAEPGPLMPILDTWWRSFHVSVIVAAAGILTAGFVFNALHLLRDAADRRSVEQPSSTVGTTRAPDGGAATAGLADRVAPDAATVGQVAVAPAEPEAPGTADPEALRRAVRPWRLAVWTFLVTSTVSWVFLATPTLEPAAGVARFLVVNLAVVAAALVVRWFVPFLPSAAVLDGLAYRTIALGFFLWTFGVIAGAMWANESWGRFWGWDPKETASFVTWVAYAAYLHARATRGTRGRGAARIGIVAFLVLMFSYYAVNLVIVGLHSYA